MTEVACRGVLQILIVARALQDVDNLAGRVPAPGDGDGLLAPQVRVGRDRRVEIRFRHGNRRDRGRRTGRLGVAQLRDARTGVGDHSVGRVGLAAEVASRKSMVARDDCRAARPGPARGRPVVAVLHGQQRLRPVGAVEEVDAFVVGDERVVGAVHDQNRWRVREVVFAAGVVLRGAGHDNGRLHARVATARVCDDAKGCDRAIRVSCGADAVCVDESRQRPRLGARRVQCGGDHEADVAGLVDDIARVGAAGGGVARQREPRRGDDESCRGPLAEQRQVDIGVRAETVREHDEGKWPAREVARIQDRRDERAFRPFRARAVRRRRSSGVDERLGDCRRWRNGLRGRARARRCGRVVRAGFVRTPAAPDARKRQRRERETYRHSPSPHRTDSISHLGPPGAGSAVDPQSVSASTASIAAILSATSIGFVSR